MIKENSKQNRIIQLDFIRVVAIVFTFFVSYIIIICFKKVNFRKNTQE